MSLPLLDQAIGAWLAEIARQDEYYKALIVTMSHIVVVATFSREALLLEYEDELLTEVTLTPQHIDFSDKAFEYLRIKDVPKKFTWRLRPPNGTLKGERIVMIHPGDAVPADRLP
jgi:hypothetical protein